jgi:glycerophosphoryl diester phosphodiesterase
VSHERGLNPDLARGPDGAYVSTSTPFIRLTLDEVKRYDVGQIRPGSAYAAQFPEQRAVPGTRIPTLAEVFALVRRSGDAHVRLNVETKIDPNHPDQSPDPEYFVALLLALLWREHFSERVMIQSFDWRTLQLVQRQAPTIPTVYLTQQQGADANVFLGLGLEVVVWTVDRAEDMALLIDMGVDGIISDRPDLLRAVAAEKGLALPAPAPVMP